VYFAGALAADLLRFVVRLLIGRFVPGRRARSPRAPRRAA
jgi:hypothetical protein